MEIQGISRTISWAMDKSEDPQGMEITCPVFHWIAGRVLDEFQIVQCYSATILILYPWNYLPSVADL